MAAIASDVLSIIQDPTLTYQQQVLALARLAESKDDSLPRDEEFVKALQEGCLCDLGEGRSPYRPRYIVPNYEKYFREGSAFLGVEPPTDIWEATNALLILYRNVPSITSFPVYLGNFTKLFAPFDRDEKQTEEALRLFLLNIDKTLTDSFVHANIGPEDNRVTRIILKLTEEMQLAVPNITLLYNEDITPESLALASIDCMLKTSKPSFANDKMYASELGENKYAIVSCYNAFRIGGGGYTLPRMRLYEISKKAKDIDDFFQRVLPFYTNLILRNIDQRVAFIVEKSNFFKSNFLVKEGLVERESFTGMVGMVGLAECCNNLLGIKDKAKGFGHNKEAEDLGVRILDAIDEMVNAHKGLYCSNCFNHYWMHAQVGIETDKGDDSPGVRVPIGYEPELYEHLLIEGRMHKHFASGVGDIFKFDQTWNNNEKAVLDIIKGAFHSGMRYFTAYNADNDVVRVTGYLVKKSEIEKLNRHEASMNNCTVFGKGAKELGHALDRRVYGSNGK